MVVVVCVCVQALEGFEKKAEAEAEGGGASGLKEAGRGMAENRGTLSTAATH